MQLNRILRNIMSLMIGHVLNLLLNFFSIVLTARYLNVDLFGEFSYLLAVVGILSKFIDLGLNPIIFRDTSQNSSNHTYINTAIVIKFLSFITVAVIFNVAAFTFGFTVTEILLSNILLSGVIFSAKYQNFRDILEIPYKVDLKMHYPMIFNLLDNFILISFVLLMPVFNGGIVYFIIIYTFSNLPGFVFLLYTLKKKYGYYLRIELNSAKEIVFQSVPLYGFSLLMIIYQQFDIILLKFFNNSFSAGIYSGASRLSFPLYIFPTALISTIFPIISKNIGVNEKQNTTVMNLGIKVVILFSFFVAVFVTFKSEEIVTFIFGKSYAQSAEPLILLLWAQVFIFINFLINDYFTAYNKQKWNFIYALILVIINLTITLALVRDYTFMAPSIAKIISACIGFVFILFIIKKIRFNINIKLIKLIYWGIITAGALYFLSYLPLAVYIILGIIIFISLVFILRFFSNEEISNLMSLFKININLRTKWFFS